MKRFFVIMTIIITFHFCFFAEVRIHMEQEGGVFKVPCVINGLKLKFIFDTGASSVCLSQSCAEMMIENGYLEESDIKGVSESKIADGSSINNLVINLKKVEVGGLVIDDVLAIVVPTQNAPLLLGQSVIQRLGKVSIDGDYLVVHNASVEYSEEEINDFFNKAEDFFNNEISIEALKYYNKVYEAYGYNTHPLVLYKMGICYSRLKDSESAMRCHLKAIEIDNGNNEDGVLFKVYPVLAAISSLNNEEEKGIDYMKLALKYAPNDIEKALLYMDIGRAYTFMSDDYDSIEAYENAIRIFKNLQQKNELSPHYEKELVRALCYKAGGLKRMYNYGSALSLYNEAKVINDYNYDELNSILINRGISECKSH